MTINWTDNEVVEIMLKNNEEAFRKTADFIERFEMEWQDVVKFLRESADEMQAQQMVVKLRDEINKPRNDS